MKKVIFTGSGGMVGSYLRQCPDFHAIMAVLPTRQQLDCHQPQACYDYIIAEKPDIVVHLAAKTNVDDCEIDRDGALCQNATATEYIAKACAQLGITMVYISTAYIFGGVAQESYNEHDIAAPINYYGQTKWLGEVAVRHYLPNNHIIIRPSWMVGGGAGRDNKFVGKIIAQLQNNVSELSIVHDQYGSLSAARNVVADIFFLMNKGFRGVFHAASHGVISRLDMARFMVDYLGKSVYIKPVSARAFARQTPLADSYGITTIFPEFQQNHADWRVDLGRYLQEFQ